MTVDDSLNQNDVGENLNQQTENISTASEDNLKVVENETDFHKENESSVEKESEELTDSQANRLRKSTEHKVSRRYENKLAEKEKEIEELQKRVSPPDDNSIYDDVLGRWIPKDTSREQYQSFIKEKTFVDQQYRQLEAELTPVRKRAVDCISRIPDFENILNTSIASGVVTPAMVINAGKEEKGLEVLYDLVKANSTKLREIQELPQQEQQRELWKLAWQKSHTSTNKSSSVDRPISPSDRSHDSNVDKKPYGEGSDADDYNEFLNRYHPDARSK